RVHLLLRPRNRGARLQAGDVLEIVTVSLLVTLLFGCECQRTPEQHIRAQKGEVLRHHANHRDWLTVEPKFFPDSTQIAAELGLPQRVTDPRRRVVASPPFLFAECPSERGRNSQQPKERWGHAVDADAEWDAVLIDALRGVVVVGLFLEHIHLPQA